MKLIPLTQGYFTKVDEDVFDELNQWSWHAHKCGKNLCYASRFDWKSQKHIYMHRVIMNTPDGLNVDHKNRNGLDNRKVNLRNCTQGDNRKNSKSHGKSKYLGVVVYNKKYKEKIYTYILASITINKQQYHLGQFKSEETAARKYDRFAKRFHGRFANLNFRYPIELENKNRL